MTRKYLDCYLDKGDKSRYPNVISKYPSLTLVIDDPDFELGSTLEMLLKHFDRIEYGGSPNSLTPIPLTSFLSQNPSFIG